MRVTRSQTASGNISSMLPIEEQIGEGSNIQNTSERIDEGDGNEPQSSGKRRTSKKVAKTGAEMIKKNGI